MNNSEFWKTTLSSLRSRFERGAEKYTGVKCLLCKESQSSGTQPVREALTQSMFDKSPLRAIIGSQANGHIGDRSGFLSGIEEFYQFWFLHSALGNLVSRSTTAAGIEDDIYDAHQQAARCEDQFNEIANEAGKVLKHVPQTEFKWVNELLSLKKLSYNEILWIVALFCVARDQPAGTPLSVSYIYPHGLDASVMDLKPDREIPESVIQQLECNPFSASVCMIDLLLSSKVEEDGPAGAFQWRWNGNLIEDQMKPRVWNMVNFLWSQEDWKATFDELLVPVYQDPEYLADNNAFGSLRREANRYFERHEIRLKVALKKATVWLQSTE